MRRSRFFLTIMAFCVGLGLFRVKYQVMALEKSHREVVKKIAESKESIHVLKAELTHLNDPARLQKLAVTHLGHAALKPSQIVAIHELPKQTTEVKVAVDPIEALMDAVNAVTPQPDALIAAKEASHAVA
jgi:cell division protein FtsL